MSNQFRPGDKVRDKKTGQIWDFGYYNDRGGVVCYNEGECSMQDSVAFKISDMIEPVTTDAQSTTAP